MNNRCQWKGNWVKIIFAAAFVFMHQPLLTFSISQSDADELKHATVTIIHKLRNDYRLPNIQYSEMLAVQAQKDSMYFTFPEGEECVYHPQDNCSEYYSLYYCEYNRLSRLTPFQIVENATDKWFNGIDRYIFPGENLDPWTCREPDYVQIGFVFMMSRRLLRVGCGKTDFKTYNTDSSLFCYFQFDFVTHPTDFSDMHFKRFCKFAPYRLHYCMKAPPTKRCKWVPFPGDGKTSNSTTAAPTTKSAAKAKENGAGKPAPPPENNKGKGFLDKYWKKTNKNKTNGGFSLPYPGPHHVLALILAYPR